MLMLTTLGSAASIRMSCCSTTCKRLYRARSSGSIAVTSIRLACTVPQRGELSTAISFRFGEPIDPVRERLLTLLRGDGAQFVLILGSSGWARTFLMYELVRELAKTGATVACALRATKHREKADAGALLAWQMHETGLRPIAPDRFRHLARLGKLILFFDGFDELALRTTCTTGPRAPGDAPQRR